MARQRAPLETEQPAMTETDQPTASGEPAPPRCPLRQQKQKLDPTRRTWSAETQQPL
jgi:hypothetical protein